MRPARFPGRSSPRRSLPGAGRWGQEDRCTSDERLRSSDPARWLEGTPSPLRLRPSPSKTAPSPAKHVPPPRSRPMQSLLRPVAVSGQMIAGIQSRTSSRHPPRLPGRKAQCISRIFFDGLFEVRSATLDAGFTALIPVVTALQIGLVGVRVHRTALREFFLFLRCYGNADLACNGPCYLALKIQNVTKISLVRLGPQMFVVGCLDQLNVNLDSVSRALYGAFDHGSNIQFLGDLGERLLSALVLHYRCSRGHPQSANLREFSDQGFGHAVGKIFFFGIVGEVLHRQYGNRSDFAAPRPARETRTDSTGIESKRNSSKNHDASGCRQDGLRNELLYSRFGNGSSGHPQPFQVHAKLARRLIAPFRILIQQFQDDRFELR